MEAEWYFYSEHGHRIQQPFLLRNLRKVFKRFEKTSTQAEHGLMLAQHSAFYTDPTNDPRTWEGLATLSSNSDKNANDRSLSPSGSETYRYTLSSLAPYPPSGTMHKGVAELKLRQEYGQIVKWETLETKFLVRDSDMYLMDPIKIEAPPKGTLTLEIQIPDMDISCEKILQKGKMFKVENYSLQLDTVVSRVKPRTRTAYYYGNHHILSTEGYTCPFTQKSFDTFEELMNHHHIFHLNIHFGIYPLDNDSILVEYIPENKPVTRDFRFYSRKGYTDAQIQLLFMPTLSLLSSEVALPELPIGESGDFN